MTNEARPLILASGSPRRRELLGRMGYEFQICSPDVDEHVSGHARDIVRTLAVRKARAGDILRAAAFKKKNRRNKPHVYR